MRQTQRTTKKSNHRNRLMWELSEWMNSCDEGYRHRDVIQSLVNASDEQVAETYRQLIMRYGTQAGAR